MRSWSANIIGCTRTDMQHEILDAGADTGRNAANREPFVGKV